MLQIPNLKLIASRPLVWALLGLLLAVPALAEDLPAAASSPAFELSLDSCSGELQLVAASEGQANELDSPATETVEAALFGAPPTRARKSCKCSCGRQACRTSADCGGGVCSFGISCC